MIGTHFTAAAEAQPATSFEIHMWDNSMESPDAARSLPHGSILTCDFATKARVGEFVLVDKKRWDTPPIVRQLVIEKGRRYLKPLNESYATEPLARDGRIMGITTRCKVIYDI